MSILDISFESFSSLELSEDEASPSNPSPRPVSPPDIATQFRDEEMLSGDSSPPVSSSLPVSSQQPSDPSSSLGCRTIQWSEEGGSSGAPMSIENGSSSLPASGITEYHSSEMDCSPALTRSVGCQTVCRKLMF
jgi:hypothetical protein